MGKRVKAAGERRARTLGLRVGLSFLAITVLSISLVMLVYGLFLGQRNARDIERQKRELIEQAKVMSAELENLLRLEEVGQGVNNNQPALDRTAIFLTATGRLLKGLPVLADADGKVLEPRARLESRLPLGFTVPEEARVDSEPRVVELESELLGRVAVAGVPLRRPPKGYHALYLFKRVVDFNQDLNRGLYLYLGIAAAVALIASLGLGLLLWRRVTHPVKELTVAAREIAHGRLDKRVEVTGDREIAELSETFNYMLGRLQESMELQRDFVANVSHELRTPLTSIEGFSTALLEGVAQNEEKRQRYLKIIIDESRRLVRILNDLLILSRLDAGEISLRPAPIDLPELLEGLRERFLSAAHEKGLSLTVEAAPGLSSLVADRDRLEQVLINLLDNAVKYTGEGGMVALRASGIGRGRILFEVSDTGPGIPPEDLPRVFDRFFRVERSRSQQHGGSGLGLAICKQLVEAMGGSISVDSRLGQGSTFRVELPA